MIVNDKELFKIVLEKNHEKILEFFRRKAEEDPKILLFNLIKHKDDFNVIIRDIMSLGSITRGLYIHVEIYSLDNENIHLFTISFNLYMDNELDMRELVNICKKHCRVSRLSHEDLYPHIFLHRIGSLSREKRLMDLDEFLNTKVDKIKISGMQVKKYLFDEENYFEKLLKLFYKTIVEDSKTTIE